MSPIPEHAPIHDASSSYFAISPDESKLYDVNHNIKSTLTELLNCEAVRHDHTMRLWVQTRLLDAEQELKRQRRRRNSLPSITLISDTPPLTGWKDDITHIAQTIEQAADRGEDVVLVMHSRGGHCGSDAAQGLSKTDREKAGKRGGIVRCVFMCAFAAPEGLSVFFATNGPDEWIDVKHTVCSPTRVGEIFYNDCSPEQIEAAKRDIKPQSTLCFLLPLTYAAWKHIPSTYLVCEKDMGIPVVAQEAMISQPGADFTVERCGASHSPFLSIPDFTAGVVRRAAGEKV
ncbi:hypothetical protein B0A54_11253 [Friedmanniomyces endolithicus]|uniref:AB hydrolase-1 domain-containing protein n=1 Tax=Friedmanniomyces endolithicus TaxID=329885 RepID=A0A4U0UN61_9PEZI|nr:hypothetical protein B0A54_11253 [Friedmanniomyces endolithicus]